MVALTVAVVDEKSKARVLKKLFEKMIKNFLDVIVMAELRNGSLSGYDLIAFVHGKFGYLMSPGTMYSLLYSLERHGLVEGVWVERKRMYKLTERGRVSLEVLLGSQDKIKGFMCSIFVQEKAEMS